MSHLLYKYRALVGTRWSILNRHCVTLVVLAPAFYWLDWKMVAAGYGVFIALQAAFIWARLTGRLERWMVTE